MTWHAEHSPGPGYRGVMLQSKEKQPFPLLLRGGRRFE
jgi:hypothetical protein